MGKSIAMAAMAALLVSAIGLAGCNSSSSSSATNKPITPQSVILSKAKDPTVQFIQLCYTYHVSSDGKSSTFRFFGDASE